MATKKHYSNFVSGIEILGIPLPMPESDDPLDFICLTCLVKTNKHIDAEVIQFGMIADKHTVCVVCEKCQTHYVVNYELEHWAYGSIGLVIPDGLLPKQEHPNLGQERRNLK